MNRKKGRQGTAAQELEGQSLRARRNRRLTEQRRKILGKHYANRYRAR